MSLIIACSGCATRLKVNDNLVGRKVKCPKCGGAVAVTPPTAAKVMPAAEEITEKRPSRPRKPAADDSDTFTPTRRATAKVRRLVDSDSYEPEETELPRPKNRPGRKKRRRSRERESEPMAGWLKWLIGVAALYICVAATGLIVAANGHVAEVIGYAIGLAVRLPISAIILVVAML